MASDSSGLYSSHSPGRVRGGSVGVEVSPTSKSRAVRAFASDGAVNQQISSDAAISTAVSTIDCHRKIVWLKGNTPVIASSPGGMLPGLACNCAADEDRPIAQIAPSPR